MTRLLLLCTVLPGCLGPVYSLKPLDKRACAESLVDDGTELVRMVDQGDSDGAFDYIPESQLLTRVEGNYDLKDGSFWWELTYVEGAWRKTDRAEGAGVILNTGDVDLEYTLTTTYLDDTTLQHTVRQIRTGCDESRRIENLDSGQISIVEATLSNGGRDWTRNYVQGPAQPTATGRQNADRSWWETTDYSANEVSVVSLVDGDGEGYALRSFEEDDGYNVVKGSWEQFFDGTVKWDFTLNNPDTTKQTWVFTENGDGTGDGSWSTSTDSCDIKYVNGGNCKRVAVFWIVF